MKTKRRSHFNATAVPAICAQENETAVAPATAASRCLETGEYRHDRLNVSINVAVAAGAFSTARVSVDDRIVVGALVCIRTDVGQVVGVVVGSGGIAIAIAITITITVAAAVTATLDGGWLRIACYAGLRLARSRSAHFRWAADCYAVGRRRHRCACTQCEQSQC